MAAVAPKHVIVKEIFVEVTKPSILTQIQKAQAKSGIEFNINGNGEAELQAPILTDVTKDATTSGHKGLDRLNDSEASKFETIKTVKSELRRAGIFMALDKNDIFTAPKGEIAAKRKKLMKAEKEALKRFVASLISGTSKTVYDFAADKDGKVFVDAAFKIIDGLIEIPLKFDGSANILEDESEYSDYIVFARQKVLSKISREFIWEKARANNMSWLTDLKPELVISGVQFYALEAMRFFGSDATYTPGKNIAGTTSAGDKAGNEMYGIVTHVKAFAFKRFEPVYWDDETAKVYTEGMDWKEASVQVVPTHIHLLAKA